MPEKKLYMIVTNDKYEIPVQFDLVGAKAVAEYIGITVQSVRDRIHKNNWGKKLKYKAVECGTYKFDKQEYTKIYGMTHDRSEYYKEYRRRKKNVQSKSK